MLHFTNSMGNQLNAGNTIVTDLNGTYVLKPRVMDFLQFSNVHDVDVPYWTWRSKTGYSNGNFLYSAPYSYAYFCNAMATKITKVV